MKHVLILPDLGQTTSEAKVLQWHKKVGDKVRRGDPVLEVETDKVDMDVESYVEGYLRKTLFNEGDMATALEAVAILTDTPDEDFQQDEAPAAKAAEPEKIAAPAPEAAKPAQKRAGKVAIAPAAKKLAEELKVDPSEVSGTGPNGLVTRKDIEAFVERRTATGGTSTSAPRALAAMAAITVESKKHIPHFYLTRELDVESAAQWRAEWNQKHPEAKATFNDLFVLAAAKALRDIPRVNMVVRDGNYEQRNTADIVLVVAEDEGLTLAPVSDPCDLSWPEFIQSMRKAAQGASTSVVAGAKESLKPALAVSNLGMYKVDSFAAIIPPDAPRCWPSAR